MENPPDWDLLAVVRSCSSTTTTTTSSTISTTISTADLDPPPPPVPPSSSPQLIIPFSQPQELTQESKTGVFFQFSSNPLDSSSSTTSFHQELQDICMPVRCTSATTAAVSSAASTTASVIHNNSFQSLSCGSLTSPVSQQQMQFRGLIKPSHMIFGGSSPSIGVGGSTPHGQRIKKRKNLMKKVCHVPAEGLSSDMWAWRKYGQKPIKGSPYPRGYYRCSSSKGCLARKQVERNRSDPKMFIVTYTAEHNHPMPTHRNSLAGSTRQKPLSSTGTPPEQPSCSSPSAALAEKSESKTEGDDLVKEEDDATDMALSDLMMQDDFYVGFEQIDGGSDGSDCFSDQFSPSSEFPWLASSSSAATAAGGS